MNTLQKKLSKKAFIKSLTAFYDEYAIDPNECFVSHGGAMLMHNLRSGTDDIDLNVSEGVWNYLLEMDNFELKHLPKNGNVEAVDILVVNEDIDVHLVDLKPEGLISEGVILFTTLEQTYEDKLALGREKDIQDIKLLKVAMGK